MILSIEVRKQLVLNFITVGESTRLEKTFDPTKFELHKIKQILLCIRT